MKTIPYIAGLFAAVVVQLPLSYFFLSLEGLVLGHGFLGTSSGIGFYFFLATIVTSLIVLFIGIPAYLGLERYGVATTVNVSLVGFLLAVIIFLSLTVVFSISGNFSSGENYYGTYRQMVVNGQRTIWGWVSLVESTFTFGVHGLFGALCFHKIKSRAHNQSKPNKLNQSGTPQSGAPV